MDRQPFSRAQLNAQPALLSVQMQGEQQVPPSPAHAEARTQRAAGSSQFAIPDDYRGASLEISFNTRGGKSSYDLTRPVINIGRDPSNDIVIDAAVVSGFHAQIVREGNQLILVHPHPLRSETTNGLIYQGRHIPGNQPFRKPLVHGDIFHIRDDHGTVVTLTYNDGSAASQSSAPESSPTPSGIPARSNSLQPQHLHLPAGNPLQGQTRPRHKFRRPASKEVKVALISTLGVLLTAITTAILGPILIAHFTAGPSTPTPTVAATPSMAHLHSSYTGSFTVTSTNVQVSPRGPITFSSIEEGDQGQVKSDMTLGSAKYTCQGSMDAGRNIVLSCTKVGDTNFHVVVKGLASQDSSHLSGTWSSSDWKYPSSYVDATWDAQG